MTEIKEESKKSSLPTLPIKRDEEEFTQIYSNTLRVNVSFQDISIVFGEILETSPGVFGIEDVADVKLPVAQGKILANILSETIKSYEKHFGEIAIPKQYKLEEYQKIIEPIVQTIKKQIS